MKGWWRTRNGTLAQIIYEHVDNGRYLTGYVYLCNTRVFTIWTKLTKDHIYQRQYDLFTRKRDNEDWPELSAIERQEQADPAD